MLVLDILLIILKDNECPKNNGKNVCFYSKYVKISHYGGTESTLNNSRCGIEAMTNII